MSLVSLRHQIGQLLIMGFSGTRIDERSAVKSWLSDLALGGVLLFDYDLANQCQGKNLTDLDQIALLTQQIQDCSLYPPFIAIDYEGGAVDRLAKIQGAPETIRPIDLSGASNERISEVAAKMAMTLKSLGFNLNFAPTLDLNLNQNEGIIGKLGRSFSDDPVEVARIAQVIVEQFAKKGIACCYKHFPGHGSALGDTHLGFVDVSSTFEHKELEPYSLLLKDQSHPVMIMTAHVINEHLDPSRLPATLSYPILTGLLRQELRFKGVIISDDLQMQAIANHYSLDEAITLTLNAGADMMIIANQLGEVDASEVIDKIEHLVVTGKIAPSRIAEAFGRVTRLKELMKLQLN